MNMLSIMITKIQSVLINKPYTSLQMPMGSEIQLKLTFQDEHARSFVDRIEGIDMKIQNSHPHIVQSELDFFNSTLTLIAKRMGKVNVIVRYSQDIYDVISINVLSSILPLSPIEVHEGATIRFSYQDDLSTNPEWESSDTSILKIDSSGFA